MDNIKKLPPLTPKVVVCLAATDALETINEWSQICATKKIDRLSQVGTAILHRLIMDTFCKGAAVTAEAHRLKAEIIGFEELDSKLVNKIVAATGGQKVDACEGTRKMPGKN